MTLGQNISSTVPGWEESGETGVFMHSGKIPERILKRAVRKKITYRSGFLAGPPGPGRDSSVYCPAGGVPMAFCTNPVTGAADTLGYRAFFRMANDICCAGAEPSGMMLDILLPEGSEEQQLRQIMDQIGSLAEEYQVDILGGHTEVMPAVTEPVITVTGVGLCREDVETSKTKPRPGMDLVMTKWAGASGMTDLIIKGKKELQKRFGKDFLERAESYGREINCLPEAAIAWESGAAALHNASAGGIFGALWELGEQCGAGLEVDLKKIPIRQETVEICEYFDENPYTTASEGVLLIVTSGGSRLLRQFEEAGIVAAVIGRIREDQDRIVTNGEEKRFLVPPGNG